MPFLNLRKSSIQMERVDHPSYRTEVKIRINAEDSQTLFARLKELSGAEGTELRVDFPAGWTVFWKLRTEETRFLLAHPEPEEWVATLAFAPEHLTDLLAGWSDQEMNFSRRIPIAKMSNLEVTLLPL